MLDIQFEGQKEGEEVFALFHKSLWSHLKTLIWTPIFIGGVIWSVVSFGFSAPTSVALAIAVIGLLYSIGRPVYLWANNLYLVTNLRIIALEQNGFLDRSLSESYLDDVCQVTANVRGPVAAMFGFGNVLVQTEAELWLKQVESPYDVKHAIFQAVEERKRSEKDAVPDRRDTHAERIRDKLKERPIIR